MGGAVGNFFRGSPGGQEVSGDIPLDPSTGLPTKNVFTSPNPSTFGRYATKFGQATNAIQQGFPGLQSRLMGQQQQQQPMPVNFNVAPQPYIPPPQAMNPNFYGY